MTSIRRLIVGWNGTDAADAALGWALAQTDRRGLHIVRSVEGDAPAVPPDERSAEERAVLIGLADRLRAANPGLDITVELRAGHPVQVLAEYLSAESLLVVGMRKGLAARYRWSVGARLAGDPRGAVAIIPLDGFAARTADGTGRVTGTADSTGRRGVVAGVDGSPASAAALRVAASEARRMREPLIACHVWSPPPVWQDATVPSEEYLDWLEQMHAALLDDALAPIIARYPDFDVERRLVRGEASRVLLDSAATASLIVVGDHGLRGIRRFLLGSVSQAIVLNLESPTIVVGADTDWSAANS